MQQEADLRSAYSENDPLTGFGNRKKLIADLAVAVQAESPPSILAVFDLAGSTDYRRICGEQAGDELIVRLADAFARAVQPTGACYRARQDESCALVYLPGNRIETFLEAAADTIREEGEASLISTSTGMARLPDEADDPIRALVVADQHLDITRGKRVPRERRSQGDRQR